MIEARRGGRGGCDSLLVAVSTIPTLASTKDTGVTTRLFHLALADAGCRHLDATPAVFPSVLKGKRAAPDPTSGIVTPDARNGYYGCAWVFDTQSPWRPMVLSR